MKIKLLTICLSILLGIYISNVYATDSRFDLDKALQLEKETYRGYLELSKHLFPETKSWKVVSEAPVLNKKDLEKLRPLLKSAYQSAEIWPDPGTEKCTFIDEIFDGINSKNITTTREFYLIDVNNDGKKDIIYSSYSPCKEGHFSLLWLAKENNSFVLSGIQPVLVLRILPDAENPMLSSVAEGCCDNIINQYFIRKFDIYLFDVRSQVTASRLLEMPNKYLSAPQPFTASKPIALRSSPKQDDEYSEVASSVYDRAVFGNIQRNYMKGAKGSILAEKTDTLGNKWLFVNVSYESNVFLLGSPIDSTVGWISADSL